MRADLERRLTPLRRRLGGLWILGWSVCVLSLGALAVVLERERDMQDFDGRLSIYATATYGLAWFDASGRFHDELLREDAEIVDAPFDIWIVEPGPPVRVLWRPQQPRYELHDLEALARRALALDPALRHTAESVQGSPLRLQVAQIFQEGHGDVPQAAVLVVGRPGGAGLLADPFVRRLGAYCLVLLVGGFGLGLHLARRNLRPIEAAFEQRERFVAAAAHELRTPLATLRAIAGELPPGPAVERIDQLVATTALVVDDLLLFAQLDAGMAVLVRERVRLDLLVESMVPEEVELQLSGGEVLADVDPNLFAVLLRNLVQNGMRYGELRQRGVRFELRPDGLVYRDLGPGIPSETLARVQAGQTLVTSSRGVGLGMTILRMIAKLHGGRLEIHNAEGGGVRIELSGFEPE